MINRIAIDIDDQPVEPPQGGLTIRISNGISRASDPWVCHGDVELAGQLAAALGAVQPQRSERWCVQVLSPINGGRDWLATNEPGRELFIGAKSDFTAAALTAWIWGCKWHRHALALHAFAFEVSRTPPPSP